MIVRIISGIIGIIIAAFVIQFGGVPFALFAILLSLIGWHEYSRAFSQAGISVTYIFGAVTILFMLCCAWLGNIEELLAVITLGMLAIFLLTVFLNGRISPVDAGVSVAGVLYIGLPFSHLIWLRFLASEDNPIDAIKSTVNFFQAGNFSEINFSDVLANMNFDVGCMFIWILFLCTWASDTFAYFVGSAIGSHKLAPSISPNKTIEGFLGSVVGTSLTAVVVGHFICGLPLIEMAVVGFILSIVATLGDLVESVIKRFTGIKDSGMLIPGHGGVLDRFDSILYTAPIFYYFILIAGLT